VNSEPISSIIDEFSEEWRAAGVEDGDVMMVHSSVKWLLIRGKRRNGHLSPDDIVQSFLNAIGPTGTLLLPAFNFNVRNGVVFDIRNTPSDMGIITESFRNRDGVIRTKHPFLSFVVGGPKASIFAECDDYTGIGANSPFALLHQLNGKVGVLDLSDNLCLSMYHYVENILNVNYRFVLDIEVDYVDWDGSKVRRSFGYYARDMEKGIITAVDPAGEELWARGLYSGERPGCGYGFRTIRAADFYDTTANIINEGRAEGMLYTIQK
jgi:aminoglycoside 3-N-acetyltransferase